MATGPRREVATRAARAPLWVAPSPGVMARVRGVDVRGGATTGSVTGSAAGSEASVYTNRRQAGGDEPGRHPATGHDTGHDQRDLDAEAGRPCVNTLFTFTGRTGGAAALGLVRSWKWSGDTSPRPRVEAPPSEHRDPGRADRRSDGAQPGPRPTHEGAGLLRPAVNADADSDECGQRLRGGMDADPGDPADDGDRVKKAPRRTWASTPDESTAHGVCDQ